MTEMDYQICAGDIAYPVESGDSAALTANGEIVSSFLLFDSAPGTASQPGECGSVTARFILSAASPLVAFAIDKPFNSPVESLPGDGVIGIRLWVYAG